MITLRFILSFLLAWAFLSPAPADNRRAPLATDEVLELLGKPEVLEMKLSDSSLGAPPLAGALARRNLFRHLQKGQRFSKASRQEILPLCRPLFLLYHRLLFYG